MNTLSQLVLAVKEGHQKGVAATKGKIAIN